MVTNLVEGNPSKLKCHRYWPDPALDNGASSRVYGGFEVKYIKQEQSPNYVVRTFQLKNKAGGQTREIKHFHYISWPDHGVPETAKEMLQFRTVVKQHHTANAKGQMVVHCSAGVGRTGTFIGIDRYLDSCISLDDQLSVLDVVRNMRSARNYMVQAQAQFIYLYEACREGLQKLQEKIDRELEMYDLAHQVEVAETPEAATVAHEDITAKVLAEINADLKRTTEQFKDNMSRKDQLGQQIKPDVSQRHVVATPYTVDIDSTGRMDGKQRKLSLAASTELWVKRQNVPMTIEDHGYISEKSAPLTSRLMALSEARTTWMTRYEDAERTWQSEQDMEGVVYDVQQQLTPLESRVASLAASEEAWKLGANVGSAMDERMNTELADLTGRLESLQFTVLNAEKRWRTKGEGMAPSTDLIQADKEANTVEQLGNLTDRLQGLQTQQTAWLKRENMKPYEVQQFHDQIMAAVEEQESIEAAFKKKEAAHERERAQRAAASEKERLAKKGFDKAKKAEISRREKAKKKALEVTSRKDEYIPAVAAAKKQKAADAKLQKEQGKIEKEMTLLRKKEETKAKKAQTVTAAEKKKNKFLKGMVAK